MKTLQIALITAMLFCALGCQTQKNIQQPDLTKQAVRQWRQLGYGMFIHFGMSTFTGSEIDDGTAPSSTYAPTALDVDQWVRVARDAGMNYAVLTSKHVAGHCLWDSKVRWQGKEFDYDIATSGDKTDVVAEYMKACKKYGLTPGIYYCLMDGHSGMGNKTWRAEALPEAYFSLVRDHITELLRNYPDIACLWLDIPRISSMQQRTVLYKQIKNIKPDCLVLFNHGLQLPKDTLFTIETFQASWPTDLFNTERHPAQPGQFYSMRNYQGKSYELGYEHCDTLCKNWFWLPNDPPRPIDELLALYRQTRLAGGNLLLNVPPDKTGQIPQYHIDALMALKKAIDTEK